ncbi:MAG: PAS domain S-box protein [Proteobacteria bacterium]|nr:PAS domain S-box protein [Pseudomonadota bacterium]
MAESKEGTLTPQDGDRLRLRLRELEAEAAKLRAALGEASPPPGPSDAFTRGDFRQPRALANQYKQIAEILDASADAIISIDNRGMVRRFNRGAEAVFGYRSSEIIGRPLDILIPERFRKDHRGHMAKFDRASESSRLMNERGEIFGQRKDGGEFPAEASIARLEGDGKPVFTVIMRDVTERKEADAALREREAQLRQAQKMARIGTFVWDDTTDSCEYCSDELAALLGITVDRFIELTAGSSQLIHHVHPDNRENYERVIEQARKAGEPYDMEFQWLRDDGELIHLREMGEPEMDLDGQIVRTFGTVQDITHIRQAEETLRQSESRLRQAQRLARMGTYVWDEVTGLCVDCSDELAALFGMSAAQFVAERGTEKEFAVFVHADDRDRLEKTVREGFASASPYEIEYRVYDAEGDIRHLREIIEPVVDENGRQIRTFGSVQDITHLRQAETALRQSELQLRTITDNLPAFIAYTDKDLRMQFANKTVAEWYGGRKEDLIGKSAIELLGKAGYKRVKSRFTEVLSGKTIRHEELRTFPDGVTRYVDSTNVPDFDAAGEVRGWFTLFTDITERKAAEEALRQSEEQLRAITDNIPAFMVYLGKDLRYRFANRRAEEWYGRPAAKIVGRHLKDVIGEEALELLRPGYEAALAGNSVRFEEIRLFPDGSERSLDITYIPDFGEDGQVRGFFALLLDITERRHAENALRQTMRSGDLLRQIATAANGATSAEEAMAVCLEAISKHGSWDLAGVFVLADDDSGDMAPAGLWWADNPDDFTAFQQATLDARFAPGKGLPGRVAKSGEPAWITDVHKDRNFPRARIAGDIAVTAGFAFPVLVGQKVAAVLEFFSRDTRERDDDLVDVAVQAGTILGRVIERQRAERALRDSEEQIRLMTDNIPILIAYIGQDKTFSFVNKTTENWYARPASELIGPPLRKLIGKAGLAKVKPRIDRALSGETVHFQETMTYPDGATRHVDATYVPHFGAHGNVRGIFSMVVDVTDRIKTEEQLLHAQKMEAIGKLTGGVAHDFNNLLAVIMGNSEIVRDKLGDADPAVRAITHAALRGAELTQRLLAFARQKPLRPEAVDLADLTRQTADVLSRTLGETIVIEVKSPREPWPAKVDTGELENAILNLAINARDAMPNGGTLTIKTNNVTLSAKKVAQFEDAAPGEYIQLSVTDTGEGMPAEVLEHAFEPFYTTKPFGEGSGLGLSMVYGFATQSGGFVTIDSQKGKGATVNIYLPRAEPGDTTSRDCRPLCQPAGQGGVIMVVEDDPDVRRLTVTLLSTMGYTVLEAEDGESALPLIQSDRHIDLLLSDIVLTGDMSGPAIAEAALVKRPDLRVMFMSGYAEDVIRRDREGRGKVMDADLLTKPFTRAQLAQKVKVAMGADDL